MAQSILTPTQKQFLNFFASEPQLAHTHYLSGGTALAEYYLQHRKSEDLDFFSQQEVDPQTITVYITKAKELLYFNAFEYQQSFNRNLYFLTFDNVDTLKLEFTYYPFEPIEKPTTCDGIQIDSLKDIAVNKLFTIYQRPRGRDFFDLDSIQQKTNWSLEELRSLAKIKFDTHLDPLQLSKQLKQVEMLKDDPILLKSQKIKTVITRILKQVTQMQNLIFI